MKKPQALRQPTQQEIQPVIQALNSGQLAQAEALAKKLLKQFPNAFVLHNLYGNALAGQNKHKDAVASFRKALEIDPSVAGLHFNVGILLTTMNRIEEAITSYKKTVKLDPSFTDAHYNLGAALQAQGLFEQASDSYKKAVELQPGFFEAMVNMGVCLQEQSQLQPAIDIYQRALTIQQDAKVYFNMGTALKNEGKLEDAIDSYNKALALDPNYAEVHSNLGEVLRDQGRYDESVMFYKQALAIDPSLPVANYSLAVYLYDSGDLKGALDHFKASQFADWEERMLYCLYKTERYDEFKKNLDELKAVKHDSPFLSTLAQHYAENFGGESDYNFCPDPMSFVFHTNIPELKGENSELRTALLKEIRSADVSEKMHLSAKYYRVSDAKYFKEVARTNLNVETLKSQLKLSFDDPDKHLAATILTEDFKVVNDGEPVYTRALEGSIAKTFRFGKKEDVIATVLTEGEEVVNTRKPTTDLAVNFVSTKFDHDDYSKESGVRTHGNLNISRQLASPHFPKITPNANISLTHYNLNNSSDNITRTIAGGGVNIDFSMNNKANLFGREINHRLSPIIRYNYRAKEVQGNIPIFDSTDKYDDIITFSDLTSGERYTGLDRITNANDITLSIESSFRDEDALAEDKDLLNFKIAQSFYTDDEVVSDTANTNYETRKSYSDIVASIDVAISNLTLSTAVQFDPDQSSIVKKENSLSYVLNPRKFVSIVLSDEGSKQTRKIYGAYPLNDSMHLFGGLDRTTSTGVTNSETTGIAYESCCWALRLAHFKEDNGSGGYNYSTGVELVLSGLGSTATPLKDRIEEKIPDYSANLRYKP